MESKVICLEMFCICNLTEYLGDMVQYNTESLWYYKDCMNAPLNIFAEDQEVH